MLGRLLVAMIFSLCLVLGAAAKDKVGTAIVNGRTVDLYSDNTWALVDDEDANCQSVAEGVRFCGDRQAWRYTSPPTGISAQYKHDDRNYGEYIVENIGTDQGLTIDSMKSLVINNAADAAKVSPNDIEVVKSEDGTVPGQTSATLVYRAAVQGLHIVFSNTIVLMKSREIQIGTFTIGDDYSPAAEELHNQFVSLTRISE